MATFRCVDCKRCTRDALKNDAPALLQQLHTPVSLPDNSCRVVFLYYHRAGTEGGAELAIAKTPYTSGGFQARRADGLLVRRHHGSRLNTCF